MSDTTVEAPYIEADSLMGGVPLFVMQDGMSNLIEAIKTHGCWLYLDEDADEPMHVFPQIYYVLAENKVVTKKTVGNTTTTSTRTEPRIFKVVSNLVGNAIHAISNGSVGLENIEEEAYFTLPPIPYTLINEIDDFFREVYRIHGTESIVILTYEPAYEKVDSPSDGWGILVPDQKNTAASCDYEPNSVVDDMPDDKDVRLVGTAHSHPGMQAFCSGTDARDQAHNDGLHITFGWKKGSVQTEFYIELQMGGGSFTLEPKDVFEDMPEAIDNPRVKEWTKKVKKGATATGTGLGAGGYTSYNSGGKSWWEDPDRFSNLPEGCPTPNKVTLVAAPLLTKDELKDCPVCDSVLKPRELETLKCLRCQSFLMTVEMKNVEEILELRQKVGMPTHELDFTKEPGPWKSVWMWEEKVGKDTKITHDFYEVYEGRSATQGSTYISGGTSKK